MNKSNNATQNRVVDIISKHPYLCTLVACLIAHTLTFVNDGLVPTNSFILTTVLVGAFAVFLVKHYVKPRKNKGLILSLSILASVVAVILLAYGYRQIPYKSIFHIVIGIAITVGACFLLKDCDDKEELIAILIIAISFIVKFYYVYKTSMYTRQHDLGSFEGEHGHLSYIQYLYDNQALRENDPRPYWQYYHPPLHHIISAAWMFVNLEIFGTNSHSVLFNGNYNYRI